MDIQNRHVFITGASRGIGAAMARSFAARGAAVSVAARSAEDLEAVASSIGGRAFVTDLGDADQVDQLIGRVEAEAGPIDVLVNNAGLETTQDFNTVDEELIRSVTRLNLEAPLVLTRNALAGMLERNRGHLVFTSSLAATGGFPGLATYCASKAGLTNFAATMGMELKDTGIGVTVIAPGPVDTPMWDNLEESADMAPMMKRLRRLQLIPQVSPDVIGRKAVEAVIADKGYVGLPKRLAVSHVLRNLPSKTTSLALTGVRLGPQLND